jgi:hypothetical protein
MELSKMECPLLIYDCLLMGTYTNDKGNNKCKYEKKCAALADYIDFIDSRNDDNNTADYFIQDSITNAINIIKSIDTFYNEKTTQQ